LEQLKNVSVVKIMKMPVVLAAAVILAGLLVQAQVVVLDQVDPQVVDHQVVAHHLVDLVLLLVLLQELHLHLFLQLFHLVDMQVALDAIVKLKTTSVPLVHPVQRVTPVVLVLMGNPVLMVLLVLMLKMLPLLIMLHKDASIVQLDLLVHLAPLVDLDLVVYKDVSDKKAEKDVPLIQELLVNKAHLVHLAQLVFQDLLVKKEEMLKNLLAALDQKVHVVQQDQLVQLELQDPMPLLEKPVHPVQMEVLAHKVPKETKDQQEKMEVMEGPEEMLHTAHAPLEMLMLMAVQVDLAAMAHIAVSKISPLHNAKNSFFLK